MDRNRTRPTPSGAATLAAVAARAGVSLATASKALNGKDRVSEQTRRRVIAAAEDIAYPVSAPIRQLGKSGTVGLVTSDLEGRFSLPILMGAEDRFGTGQVSVFLCDARGDAIRERHYVSALLGRKVDAIMVVGSRTDARTPIGRDLPVPVIYVYTPSSDPRDFSLTPDNVMAGRLATEHLIDTGRRRIAHITGPIEQQAAIDRARGIAEALAGPGLALAYETPQGEWTERWGRTATAMLIEQGRAFDALLCDSDQIARGAIDALRERGMAIPGDVAVMGFDDWDVIVDGTHPPLSSVSFNLAELGNAAAEWLFAAMDGRALPEGIVYRPSSLVIRGSTTRAI